MALPLALLAVILIIAAAAIVALERTRRSAREAAARATVTADVSRLLAEVTHAEEALESVLRLIVPAVADWAIIHIADERGIRRAAAVHRDPRREADVLAYFDRVPFDPEWPQGPARAIRNGVAEQLDDDLARIMSTQSETDRRLAESAGMVSMIVVPLRARQHTVGALTLVRGGGRRRFTPIENDHAKDIAHRIGLAVENARLYTEARTLFDQTITANFVSTADGRLLACNQAFAHLLGFDTIGDTLAQRVETFYCEPSDRERVIAELRSKRQLVAYEGTLQRRDGRRVPIVENAVGTFDEKGDLVKITGFIVDQTAQKDLEQQLRQSQRLEAVGQLAGGIAHDFNNLLTVIIGCVDLLKSERATPAHGTHDPIEEIAKASRRAAALTQQLLAFSRRQVLQPRTIDPNEALRNLHSMLRRLVKESIVLVFDLNPSVPPVRVDPGQLDQVIINLVVNAADAIPAEGTVTVSTGTIDVERGRTPPNPFITSGSYVTFEVRDTGVGMDEATRARVFEPFFTTKPVGKGTGLGLSTVYGIVKQSGGYVWIASRTGAGTTVTVYLPRGDSR